MFNRFLDKLGNFSYKSRYLMTGIFILLFITVTILHGQINIAYSMAEKNKINDIFPQRDTLVILYDNQDERKIPKLVSDIETQKGIISVNAYSTSINKEMTSTELASTMGIDPTMVNVLYYVYTYGYQTNDMTLPTFINYVKDDIMTNDQFNQYFDDDTKNTITNYANMINSITSNYEYSSTELANVTGMTQSNIEQLFMLASQQSGSSVIKMTLPSFVNMLLTNEAISSTLSDAQKQSLTSLQSLCTTVTSNSLLSAEDLAPLFTMKSSTFNSNMINLLYLYHVSQNVDLSSVKIGMYDFINFLVRNVSTNESFNLLFNTDTLTNLNSAKAQLDAGKTQLVGHNYSRMIVSLNYKPESDQMNHFYDWLSDQLDNNMHGHYYLIGNSAMSHEMSQTFQQNFLFISLLTSIAIFAIIVIAFRKISIPLILVLLIQSGVYITMTVMIINQVHMYFIALLIVQGLLMGATIDYGILFTTYYRENRKILPIHEALKETYKKSIHTILTSAFIMIFVTGIISLTVSPDIAQILKTISIGATSATILILFFLPSILATFDRFIINKIKVN